MISYVIINHIDNYIRNPYRFVNPLVTLTAEKASIETIGESGQGQLILQEKCFSFSRPMPIIFDFWLLCLCLSGHAYVLSRLF
jgi:hypothetical protein